jgi:hypothetical protein
MIYGRTRETTHEKLHGHVTATEMIRRRVEYVGPQVDWADVPRPLWTVQLSQRTARKLLWATIRRFTAGKRRQW